MMGHIVDTLPLFAADYSAAASTVREMGGLALILCPDGCMGNFTRFDDMQWMDNPGNVLQMELREMDVIFGDVKVSRDFTERLKELKYRFIAIINTPVSALVGIDTGSLAKSISDITGIPAFSVKTNGYGTYHDGISKVMEKMLSCIRPAASDEPVIGLLGYNCLDNTKDELKEIISEVGSATGCRIIAFPGSGYDDLGLIRNAKKLILVSSAGLGLARQLKEELGIPYEFYSPFRQTQKGCGEILIISEQVRGNAMRNHLLDRGISSDVATFFNFDTCNASEHDVRITTEDDVRSLCKDRRYRAVIGDPLFDNLVGDIRFIPDPHPAVSSHLFNESKHSMADCSWLDNYL